ncbi:alginate lyase family protein [Antrihabitans cavernicola]|uniref:Uncharacterized protein n=1 Tax=Antrihabitans cavernicola TaxID=2495913 RepID=A0A5A7SH92_9NOCA|nr:alginate lyase family protein [Spelaeibacter cavernicola]KAA0023855.1 hypothetical protein FOY51_04495 [Spelaeibacter cavernicola]
MGRIDWYLGRLRTMSPQEVVWRVGSVSRGVLSESRRPISDTDLVPNGDWDAALARLRSSTDRPVLLDGARAESIERQFPAQVAEIVKAAENAVEFRFSFFGHGEVQLETPIDWHRDPVAGIRWPTSPSRRINHRAGGRDPKWIWELNRLQHLVWLAEAWLFTGNEKFSDAAFEQLDTWIDQNPPGIGIAWRGAFEAGIRSISVSIALQGLRDAPGLTADRYRRIARMLAYSAEYCWRERSRFSSANNHLLGEMVGLATTAILLPDLCPAAKLEKRALDVLTREADKQILPDGAGAEQAFGYQVSTGELFSIVATLLARRDDRPPQILLNAIDRSARFLGTVMGDDDPAPRYGDADEGFGVRLGVAKLPSVREHLGVLAAITGNEIARRAGVDSISARWFAPDGALPEISDGGAAIPDMYASDGGVVVLRSDRRRIMMDVGPLGYLSIAAHGHADALAMTLSLQGQTVIGDPGTGSYYVHPDWRSAHRSTRAHATLSVDGLDQSVMAGPFMWSRHARVRTRSVDLTRGVIDAEHDGYIRLDEPVTHRRWTIAPPFGMSLVVVDMISGVGRHEVRTAWPLHPSLDVRADGLTHRVSRNGQSVVRIDHAANIEAVPYEIRGDQKSNLGWWSDRLESREESWLVGVGCVGHMPVVLATIIVTEPDEQPPIRAFEVAIRGGLVDVKWAAGDAEMSVRIDPARSGAVDCRGFAEPVTKRPPITTSDW